MRGNEGRAKSRGRQFADYLWKTLTYMAVWMRHGYGGRESVEAPCRQANEKYRKNRRKYLIFSTLILI